MLHFFYSRKILLFLGTFFLPFGFDFLFKLTLDLTGSYIITDCIFYAISFTFLIIHFVIIKTNPVEEINKRALDTKLKIMEFKSKF